MEEESLRTPLLETSNNSTSTDPQERISDDRVQSANESVVTTSSSSDSANIPATDVTSVREIYKNSWLKHIPCIEKWSGRLYKHQRPEKFWVVFCVHDEKEAFLEFYENRRSAYSHVPLSSTSLSHCLHVSPTIVVQENDHEFVITLETQVIKLAASTQEQMVEWMDTIRNKLRELGILEPKDNLYSKEPITSSRTSFDNSSLLSESLISLELQNQDGSRASQISLNPDRIALRDPNSPLPPVPPTTPVTTVFYSSSSSNSVFVRSTSFIQLTSRSSNSSLISSTPSTNGTSTSSLNSDVVISTAISSHTVSTVTTTPNERLIQLDVSTASEENPGPSLTENLSLQYSQSVPNTPTTVVSTLYEPLFYPPLTNQPSANASPRTSNYENIPSPLVQSPGDVTPTLPPVLPPRTSNERRLSSVSDVVYRNRNASRRASTSDPSLRISADSVSVVSSHVSRRTSMGGVVPSVGVPHRQNSDGSLEHRLHSYSNIPQNSHERNIQISNSSDHPFLTDENGRLLSLREAQVLKLQSEISHKSGVRLILRKRDCINAIAFVECYGCVWIAGWKQKEHPLLHNTFHIGDLILSISGHRIHNIQDTMKAIKMQQHLTVEFIIKRIPYGKVLAMKKEYEGQDLGIIRDGGTAEIKEIKLGSLTAKHGLPPKAPSIDGHGTCNWFLTEVNHRPLNLFFKDNEVNDRLNAVGLDISILVQPLDFVKSLKKQLKSLRGYKDYTLQ